MALQETQSEPSMEEILASIRRIISEDEAPAAQEPVLELSQPAQETPPVVAAAAPAVEDDDLLVFDQAEPAPPPPALTHRTSAPAPQAPAESIMSEPLVAAAAQSFTRLAGSLRLTEVQGQTVEGVVRELLRPMLREWLDEHLPAIVETKVEAELDRISRLAR
jgi:uncharacterized protein